MQRRALVVEDDSETLKLLDCWLQSQAIETRLARTYADARHLLRLGEPDLALVDVRLPDGDGLDVLRLLSPRVQTLVMTGAASIDGAIAAVRDGADEYLSKPLDLDRLARFLRGERRTHAGDGDAHREGSTVHGMRFGPSEESAALQEDLREASRSASAVALIGDRGTGKSLTARFLHLESGARRAAYVVVPPDVWVDRDTLESPTSLGGRVESELERVVGRLREGGSVCLDDVPDHAIPRAVRALEWLRKRVTAEVRLVLTSRATTEPRGFDAVIRMPALSERPVKDRLDLAHHLMAARVLGGIARQRLGPSAADEIARAALPGNVAQVERTLALARTVATGTVVTRRHVRFALRSTTRDENYHIEVGMPLAEVDRRLFLGALERCNFDKRAAAAMLGVSLRTVYNRCHQYLDSEPKDHGSD